MHREPRWGAEFVEQLLLPIVNIVFLMIPVLLVVIELTSLAALQASTPSAAQSAQAPATWVPRPAPEPSRNPLEVAGPSRPGARSQAPLIPDPMVGYGP